MHDISDFQYLYINIFFIPSQNLYISNLNQYSSWKVESWKNYINAHS